MPAGFPDPGSIVFHGPYIALAAKDIQVIPYLLDLFIVPFSGKGEGVRYPEFSVEAVNDSFLVVMRQKPLTGNVFNARYLFQFPLQAYFRPTVVTIPVRHRTSGFAAGARAGDPQQRGQ